MGSEIEFKSYEQHQGSLLPGFVGDALDPADRVFFIDDVVEAMDLAAFEARYSAVGGRRARLPAVAAAEAMAVRGDRGGP